MNDNSKTNEQLIVEVENLKRQIGELEKTRSEFQFNRIQLILETTMDSYILADTDGQIIDINQAYCDLIGYTREELLNMNIRQLEVKTPPEEVERLIQEMVGKGKDRFETKHLHKNGEVLDLETSISISHNGEAPMVAAFMRDITDRKKAEKTLRDSEYLLRESQKVASLGSYILDLQNGIWESSTNLEAIFGIDRKYKTDIDGWIQIVHPDDQSMMQAYFSKSVLENYEAFNKEYRIKRINDQKVRWVHGFGKLEFSDDGKPVRMIGTVQDITKRKKTEKKLRESELRFRTIIEHATDALFISDFEGNILEINNKACENLGYSKDELKSMKIGDVTEQYDDSDFRKSILSNILRGETMTIESFQRRKDGTTYPVEINLGIIKLSKVKVLLGFARDITERKKIEEVLLKMNLAINNSSEVIFMTDIEGIITFVNSEFTKMYGFTAEEVVGKVTPRILKSGLFDKEISKQLWAALLNKQSIPASQYINKCKNGELIDIEGSADPIIDEKGNILGFLGVQRDITKRKRAEQELIQALEKATESDRLKSTFLATMSHELRTPLNAIIGFSDIIDEKISVEEIVDFSKMINSSGNQLLSIVEDLFDITLIDTGEMRIRKKKENLDSIMKHVHEIIYVEQKTTSKDNLDLKMMIPNQSSSIIINTDAVKLKQILINLLKNALKFTKEGHVHYGYNVEKDQNKTIIKFFVEDTGRGIPENKRELIFDIFRQVDDTPSSPYGGTGIGLSIAKRLTELLGGKIWVDSVVGEGSVFHFTIPAEDVRIDDRTNESEIEVVSEKERKLGIKTILIVEDDRPSYRYLKTVLEKEGIITIWADSGKNAIECCRANSDIDLVLMDINMPEMNGYEATREIKRSMPGLPIIAQTAYAVSGDMEKSIAAGCDDYISKPIKKEELLKKIEKLLG